MRVVVALVALASLAFAGGAAAHVNNGKGHGPKAAAVGASTIVLNQTDVRLGDSVTFTTDIEPLNGGEYPLIDVVCSQGGVTVFSQLDFPDAQFLLGGGSSDWRTSGGAASCRADLDAYDGTGAYWTVRLLASTTFEAGG